MTKPKKQVIADLINLIAQLNYAVERNNGKTTITKADIEVLKAAWEALNVRN